MQPLHIIKIGGNVIDDHLQLDNFLELFSKIHGHKLLVHGGGKLATTLANKLGVNQTIIDGRRVTNTKTLKITTMVYGGLINKNIVTKLQALNCNAIGFCGADGNLVKSKKREHSEIDYGYVGDILSDGVNVILFEQFINMGIIPIICPITHDGAGNLLNTNADTMASRISSALSSTYNTTLTYCFEKNGVLMDVEHEESCIPALNKKAYLKLKAEGIISKGMIPKLDNAFDALESGVKHVTICHAKYLSTVTSPIKGTQLLNS